MRRLAFPLITLMVAFVVSGSMAELRSDGPAPVTPTHLAPFVTAFLSP